MVPKGIVVHSTGANNPYLKRYVDAPEEVGINKYGNHWNVDMPEGRKVCVHAFIGYDKNKQIRIAELLPLNICCWGVGRGTKGSHNYNPAYIQFEICEDNITDKKYYDKVFEVAAEYCAELCQKYGIQIGNIVSHYEVYRLGYGCNHGDPEYWMKKFGKTMGDFRNRVSEILKSNVDRKENKEETVIENNAIKKGDLVSVANDATYYNGKTIPSWVKSQRWFVKSTPVGERVVIDMNESGTNHICSPVHKKFLTVVKKVRSNCPYLVKVTSDCLTIHKDAGINNAKVGEITDHGVYTIVEEKKGDGASLWGKLKSGVGWISLDYVKKSK